jgi:Na+-driven multidrug efflux pump
VALASWLVLPFGAGWGATGAWFAMSFTQGIQGVLTILAFRQGAWKTKNV